MFEPLSELAETRAQLSLAANKIRRMEEDAVEAARAANHIIKQLEKRLAAQDLAATLQAVVTPPTPRPAAIVLSHSNNTFFRMIMSAICCCNTAAPHVDAALGVQADEVSLELLPDEDGSSTEAWSLVQWAKGVGVHRAVAAALQAPLAAQQRASVPGAALEYVKGLTSREQVAQLLGTRHFLATLVELVWSELTTLQSVGAATSKDMESKFAGAVALSYSSLDTFFRGLEGIVGSPSPKVLGGMRDDHLQGPGTESFDVFITGNYGVETCSQIEWLYVADATATPEKLGIPCWPVESAAKMPERAYARQRRSLESLEVAAADTNRQLREANQPEVMVEEILAACLYTGPMFVKYNAVLRGLASESPFLRNQMVSLCCPNDVTDAYLGSTPRDKLFLVAAGNITFEVAQQSLNKYSTTLHAINSVIIKLGKLTKAIKIYRGIADMKLPDEFWTPNHFGVRGGVEQAFMSTTTERAVAMGYASGGRSVDGRGNRRGAGIVIEVQQGMVNRGADISSFSQYPHEREVLFGPLTGIEVLRTRVEVSVVVIECSLSINLTALTIEQVLGKRQKIVRDMVEQLRRGTQRDVETKPAWMMLRDVDGRCPAVDRFFKDMLAPLAEHEATHYNENGPLGDAIQEAVVFADSIAHWPEGLKELTARRPALRLGTEAEVLLHGLFGSGSAPVPEEDEGTAAQTPVFGSTHFGAAPPSDAVLSRNEADGLCCLAWHAATLDVPLSIDLEDVKASPEILAVACTLSPSVTSLSLKNTCLTANGGNTVALRRLCGVLRGGHTPQLATLDLARNQLGPADLERLSAALQDIRSLTSLDLSNNALCGILLKDVDDGGLSSNYTAKGITAMAEALHANCSLTKLSLSNNCLRDEGVIAVSNALSKSKVTKLQELDLANNFFGADGAKAVATYCACAVTGSLSRVDVRGNNLAGEGASQLSAAILGNLKIEMFNEIPIKEMRANSFTELDLKEKRFGVEGSMVVAGLIPMMAMLTICNLLKNDLDIKSAMMLAKIGTEKHIMLSGIKHDQTEASFSSNNLQPADGILIASDLRVSTAVKHLSVTHNGILGEAAQQLATAALGSSSLEVFSEVPIKGLREDKLIELNLAIKGLGPTEGIVLAALIKFSPVLNTLNLADNALCGVHVGRMDPTEVEGTYDVTGIQALATALVGNRVLTILNLYNNSIGAEGAKAIADALKSGSTVLTDLNLRATHIGTEGAKAIVDALSSGRAVLSTLHLGENGLGDEGAIAIAKAMEVNAVLTDLNLWENQIGPEGAMAVAGALQSGKAVLTSLDLSWNELDAEAGKALAASLAVHAALKKLDLGFNKLNDDAKGALRAAAKAGLKIEL